MDLLLGGYEKKLTEFDRICWIDRIGFLSDLSNFKSRKREQGSFVLGSISFSVHTIPISVKFNGSLKI